MTEPINAITLTQVFAWVLMACGAIATIGTAVSTVIKAVKAARQPNIDQNSQIAQLQAENKEMRHRMDKIESKFDQSEDGNRVTQRAILALLDHGLDGNNIEQMQSAKVELQNYLIKK